MELTLDQVRAFVAVVDHRGFTAAGRKLGRVQSAVSQAIAAIEDQLGYPLFERPRRTAKLTARGEALLPRAREMLSSYEGFTRHARSLAGDLEPEFSFVFDSLFPIDSVGALSCVLADRFPDRPQRLGFETLGSVVAQVLDGTYALGLVGPGAADDPALARVDIGRLRLLPVVASTHPLAVLRSPLTAETIAHHRQILFVSRDSDAQPCVASIASSTWRVADIHAKRDLISRGLGWGNLPAPMIQEELDAKRLVPLEIEGAGADELLMMTVIYRRSEGFGPVGRAAIEVLRDLCE
ncbi:MAG: LysR family transcriptional regulator [Nannocystaceae bacterium]|nr:LysR family transcriptional regulator [Nannocystaceae bacterium]